MLALIAGAGALPAAVAGAQEVPPLVCAMEGFAPDGLVPDLSFRLETLGTLLERLTERGVTDVCLAGAIRRPEIDPARIDAATKPLVPRLAAALAAGDDGALRTVLDIFEEAGLRVRGAAELAPELLPTPGVIGRTAPTDEAKRDAQRGQEILATLSSADVGQSCAVRAGQALAVEGVFGTDWMLASLIARPDAGGGVLVKLPKAGQDRRVDLPTIGPETVEGAAKAALDGIVIAAGGVIVLDLEAVRETCERLGLFLWVRECASS